MWPLLPALPLLVLGSEFAILNEENDKNSSEKLDKGLKMGGNKRFGTICWCRNVLCIVIG